MLTGGSINRYLSGFSSCKTIVALGITPTSLKCERDTCSHVIIRGRSAWSVIYCLTYLNCMSPVWGSTPASARVIRYWLTQIGAKLQSSASNLVWTNRTAVCGSLERSNESWVAMKYFKYRNLLTSNQKLSGRHHARQVRLNLIGKSSKARRSIVTWMDSQVVKRLWRWATHPLHSSANVTRLHMW